MNARIAALALLLAPSLLVAESIRCGSQLIIKDIVRIDDLEYGHD